jgi:phosphoglycerol transferase MdoB-like AlkP superfamily enzyme
MRKALRQWLTAARPLLLFYLFFLLVSLTGRLVLIGQHWAALEAGGANIGMALLVGIRIDTMAAGIILAPPTLLLFLWPPAARKTGERILGFYFLTMVLITLYMEIATPPFIAEFDARPNEIFVNYLKYPREVIGTILATHWGSLLFALAALSVIAFVYLRWWRQSSLFTRALAVPYKLRLAFLLPTALLVFAGIRSSFGHRPANLSDATYCNCHIANEIAKNTLYAVGYAVYAKRKFEVDVKLYGRMPAAEAIARVRRLLRIRKADLVEPDRYPLLRRVSSHFPERGKRPRNLVVIIEESLGAQFVAAAGGKPGITPNLNRLSREGILFTRLYASGTRSVRGMEAIVGGFLPIPGTSVLKRNLSQKDFFSLAQLLAPRGYDCSFIYGGEKRFDNMGSWYYGNGFNRIIDEPDFVNPVFHGIWGVCDEDLMDRADLEYTKMHSRQQPFLSVMFTTTNHTPFEFPPGRIELLPGVPPACDENAVKFNDYALGRFFARARAHGYYDDTVFVIVADHNVRVRSSPNGVMPVANYRIFGLILGGGIAPLRYQRLATQMDVTATALDLLGQDFVMPIIGRSIFCADKIDFALMQFYSTYGYLRDNQMAVFEPKAEPRTFAVTGSGGDDLAPRPHDRELERDGLALLRLSSWLYQQRLYTLPPKWAGLDRRR